MITKRTNRVNNLASLLEKKSEEHIVRKKSPVAARYLFALQRWILFLIVARNVVNDSFILVKVQLVMLYKAK